MLNFDRNSRCDYCDEGCSPVEEFKECPECDWVGHDDSCFEEHYLTEHDGNTLEETSDEVPEEYDEETLAGTEQDF